MLLKFPPSISDSQKRDLKYQILDWSLTNGIVFESLENPGTGCNVPVTLFPTPFSRHGFENALEIQILYNELYHSVFTHPEIVIDELSVASADEFTMRLINIYKKCSKTHTQTLTGGVFRSDYIVDKSRVSAEEGRQIKQVEFNTVSVSFGALSSKVTEMHKFLAETAKKSVHGEVPISDSLKLISKGLATMHSAYGCAESVILFVVQPDEVNIMDQRLIEYELFRKYGILCVRATLEQVTRKTTIGDRNRLIFIPLGVEVSVVYYRTGYGPNDYPTESEWEARELLESSHAVQCPSVLTQLCGTKKIQQLLTVPQFIETRLKPKLNADELNLLRKTFTGMWPMDHDSELGMEGQRLAFESPERFVLKPQREGGGNNIYKKDIPAYLEEIGRENWQEYVLMELIDSPKVSNTILRDNELVSGRIVSELGVFGTVLWDIDQKRGLMNNQAGFLLRTKLQKSNEGGIAAGFGCLDAILLPSR